MRAAVVKDFHHPITGVMHKRGDVLIDDDLAPVLDDAELAHRVAVTSRLEREPSAAAAPAAAAAPPAPPQPPAPAAAANVKE